MRGEAAVVENARGDRLQFPVSLEEFGAYQVRPLVRDRPPGTGLKRLFCRSHPGGEVLARKWGGGEEKPSTHVGEFETLERHPETLASLVEAADEGRWRGLQPESAEGALLVSGVPFPHTGAWGLPPNC